MNESNRVVVKVESLSKTFKLPHDRQTSIKGLAINSFKKKKYEKQKVLNNISFEIKEGEFFGIVGRNGSGKSTLLKLLAEIYTPTKGKLIIKGSITPFIELGVGFNPELTGKENVYLNGALLGFSRPEIRSMYNDIVSFAELEKFMDQKLKNYSSGMQVRLAFSIAIRAEGDILLLDEVLAVGDAAFQQKCYDYFSTLKNSNRTIILVSHNMMAVEQFCSRALLLENGEVKEIGEAGAIAAHYENMFIQEEAQKIRKSRKTNNKDNESESIELLSTKVYQNDLSKITIDAKEDFVIEISIKSKNNIKGLNVGLNVKTHDKIMIFSADTFAWIGSIPFRKGETKNIKFNIQNILANGVYTVNLGIANSDGETQKLLLRVDNATEFVVGGVKFHKKSLTRPNITVNLTN